MDRFGRSKVEVAPESRIRVVVALCEAVLLDMASQLPLAQLRSLATEGPSRRGHVPTMVTLKNTWRNSQKLIRTHPQNPDQFSKK